MFLYLLFGDPVSLVGIEHVKRQGDGYFFPFVRIVEKRQQLIDVLENGQVLQSQLRLLLGVGQRGVETVQPI